MKKNNKIITWCQFSLMKGILAFLLLSFFACSESVDSLNNEPGNLIFFDLKSFLLKEQDRIAERTNLVKTVFVNDQQESKELSGLDFEKELKPFLDADLNRPAWTDKYRIDSMMNGSGVLEKLTYDALDMKLSVQQMTIEFKDEELVKIDIKKESSSLVADTRQHLIYEPSTGFSIESTQDVSMIAPNTFRISIGY